MSRSPNLGSISTRLRRIAQLAREDRERSFVSLAHYVDEYWLREAYSRTRKDGAAGVDGQRRRSTRRTWRATCGTFSTASSPVVTERRRCGGSRFRRAPGRRPGRSGSPPSRTRCFSEQTRGSRRMLRGKDPAIDRRACADKRFQAHVERERSCVVETIIGVIARAQERYGVSVIDVKQMSSHLLCAAAHKPCYVERRIMWSC